MAASDSYRILVIDDEQVVLDASARLLSAEGFDVLTAPTAEAGLDLLDSASPDVALVDLKLPGMSGLEFMERSHERNPGLQIVLTTGVSTADQAVAALNHGAFDFLPKPFTYEELMSPILRALRHRQIEEGKVGPAEGHEGSDLYFLGLQAWARLEVDLVVRVGVTGVFQSTAGQVAEIILPKINAEMRQGGALGRVRTADARWHVALASVGGRVASINEDLRNAPETVNQDPLGEGWIATIEAKNLTHDLARLSRVAPDIGR